MSQFLFRFTAVATTAFVMTILAMVAMLLDESEAPVNVWFNDNGGTVLVVEVLAIVLLGLGAMFADRRESRARADSPNQNSSPPEQST